MLAAPSRRLVEGASMSGSLYDAIAGAGYAVPQQIVWDGNLHRFATDERKRHKKDGWYIAHDDAGGKAGAFGSWRSGESHTWSNGTGRQYSSVEWADIERKKALAVAEEKKEKEQAALRAERLFESAQEVTESPYLTRKGITCPEGIRAVTGMSSKAFGFEGAEYPLTGLLVPLRNKDGAIRSLQLIPDNPQQEKMFMKGGQVGGCFHALGKIAGARRIDIVEGLATGQSVRSATHSTVLIAFSAGNLPKVAEVARALNATAEIVIDADDDENNQGNIKAIEAAKRCGGIVKLPGNGCNDFNDLHREHGLGAVQAVLMPAAPALVSVDWKAELIVKVKEDGSQSIPCRVHNLMLILQHAPEFAGRIRFNRFSEAPNIDGRDVDDVGPIQIMATLEKNWVKEQVKFEYIQKAIQVVAANNTFHPVVDYLKSLEWDGIPRINHFFSDHFGVEHNAYHTGVARSLFISAVLRVLFPGCKCDTMTILQGAQGAGKTEVWIALFGQWHAEVIDSLNGKDFFSGQRGVWCADFGELDQFNKTETTRIKQILTMREDNYRTHYGRTHAKHPRQLVFVGGTNSHEWLNDATGGRRFLPVKVEKIDVEAVAANRDQLWAQAMALAQNPGQWWEIEGAEEAQAESYAGDTWEEVIAEAVFHKAQVTVADILTNVLKIEVGKQTKSDQTRAGNVLRRLGWAAKQEMMSGARVRVYRRRK
jgi:putative DNA primase/helicase